MKSTLYLTILAAAMLVCPALAQPPSSMHCSKPTKWTTVCQFDDGTVNETGSFDDGTYYSDWYTSKEWILHLHRGKVIADADMTKEQKIDKENAAIVATAKLCKRKGT